MRGIPIILATFMVTALAMSAETAPPKSVGVGTDDVVRMLRQRAAWQDPVQLVATIEKKLFRDGKQVGVQNEWFRLVTVPSGGAYRLDYLFDSPTGRGMKSMWTCLEDGGKSVRVTRGIPEERVEDVKKGDFSKLATGSARIESGVNPSVDYILRAFGFRTDILESSVQVPGVPSRIDTSAGSHFVMEQGKFKFVYDLDKMIPLENTILSGSRPGEIAQKIQVDSLFQTGALWLPSKIRYEENNFSERLFDTTITYTVDTTSTKILDTPAFEKLLKEIIPPGASVTDVAKKIQYKATEYGDGSAVPDSSSVRKMLDQTIRKTEEISPSK